MRYATAAGSVKPSTTDSRPKRPAPDFPSPACASKSRSSSSFAASSPSHRTAGYSKGALALELRLKATTRPTRDIDLGRDDDEQAAIEDMTAAQQLALDDFFTYNAIRTDEFDRTDEFAAVRFHVTAHRAAVRRELARFRGREIDTAGDGFLATFDGPARAIQCACSIRGAVHGLGLEVRSGLHTGECELIDGGVGGIAVHTGARVAALAEPGEVLVSRTVRDLVAGSGLAFEDRGVSRLKGVEGDWQLYAVV